MKNQGMNRNINKEITKSSLIELIIDFLKIKNKKTKKARKNPSFFTEKYLTPDFPETF